MPKSRIIDRDHGYQQAKRAWEAVAGTQPRVKVGITGEKALAERTTEDGGTVTNVEIAGFHEWGQGVPERSFIRSTTDRHEKRYRGELRRLAAVVSEGKIGARQALDAFGLHVVGDMKATIQAGIPPALSEETLRRKTVNGKTGTTPLIDTGQLIGSITHEVVEAGDGGAP